MMKVICCQLAIVWESKAENMAKVRSLLRDRPVPRGALVVLPEMFATGFSMDAEQMCEADPSPTEEFLAGLALEHGVYLLGGLARLGGAGQKMNQAVAFSPEGRLLARYGKRRLFTPGGEADHYEAGQEATTFCWQSMVVAPFICYDLRFPELFREAVCRGAQVLVVIANWPTARVQHWITLLRARAIENQAYAVGVNRCGQDPKHPYPGRTLIVDPQGETVAEAGGTEAVVGAELDLERVLAWREEFPALADMRQGGEIIEGCDRP